MTLTISIISTSLLNVNDDIILSRLDLTQFSINSYHHQLIKEHK